jgi:hypothetical protein
VVRDAENYARREPLIFLGAAFAVGFIAARFLKASSPGSDYAREYGTNGRTFRRYEDEYGYGGGAGYGREFGGTYSGETPGSSWSGGSASRVGGSAATDEG